MRPALHAGFQNTSLQLNERTKTNITRHPENSIQPLTGGGGNIMLCCGDIFLQSG